MTAQLFFITFTGTAVRFTALARFFDRLVSIKTPLNMTPPSEVAISAAVGDSSWLDFLDDASIERLTLGGDNWVLEDILFCVLHGEYQLVDVTFDGTAGRLNYDPWAYPFGGTDPLKALIRTFGLEVTGDSFHDGFAEWQRGQPPR